MTETVQSPTQSQPASDEPTRTASLPTPVRQDSSSSTGSISTESSSVSPGAAPKTAPVRRMSLHDLVNKLDRETPKSPDKHLPTLEPDQQQKVAAVSDVMREEYDRGRMTIHSRHLETVDAIAEELSRARDEEDMDAASSDGEVPVSRYQEYPQDPQQRAPQGIQAGSAQHAESAPTQNPNPARPATNELPPGYAD